MLKLIELQYQREIDRRLKKEQKVKLEEEIGEKILDSPLRRAREYAQTIAGSPSPIKRIVTKGTYNFEISPEKTKPMSPGKTVNLRPAPKTGLKATFGAKNSSAKATMVVDSKNISASDSKVASLTGSHQRQKSKQL